MNAVLLISHGSRLEETKEQVSSLCQEIQKKTKLSIVSFAFLEIARPTIQEGVDECVNRGASKIIILLNFLNAGIHVDKDIPQIIKDCKHKHPGVEIVLSGPVGQHKSISDIFVNIINDII